MFRVPRHVLEQLKCDLCDGYLSSKPVVVKSEKQICGKCYRILPGEEKEKCVRQIGLESLAEVMIFPCRYNVYGCGVSFPWNNENAHETECQYRYRNAPVSSRNSYYCDVADKAVIKCETGEIKAVFGCELKENKYSKEFKNLTYRLKLNANCDHSLVLRKSNSNEIDMSNIEIQVEGSVFLGGQPEIVYTNVKTKQLVENIYETVTTTPREEKRCFKCKIDNYYENTRLCTVCLEKLTRDSKTVCKNFHKGCDIILPQEDISRHEADCIYNNIHCPLTTCNIIDTLDAIKDHLKNHHTDEIHLSNELTKKFLNKDEILIIYCYESIFKCVYFYYKTFVEFSVTYIGPSGEASNYRYEISVGNEASIVTKKSSCSDWNNRNLEKGVTFDRSDLVITNKKLSFEANLRIVHV